jgi:hypothetical protein
MAAPRLDFAVTLLDGRRVVGRYDCNHPHYRRRLLGQLNRGERRHDLAR